MNRCRDTADVQPEFRFFIDPLSLARSGFRGNTAVLTAMNFLPSVGLDGVLGFGASADLHNEQFKVVMHSHLLLANPKSGVLEVLALKPGESEPQPFVPNNIINYSNTHWDPPKAFVEVQKMIDTFMGEGHFESEFIGQFRDTFELDLETDVINQLSGRITHLQWSQPDSPYLMNNTCQALAIGVKDSEEAQKVLETIMEYARARMRKRDENAEPWPKSDHQGVSVWTMASAEDMEKRWQERREKRGREGTNDSFRMPYPTYSILDDHVIVSDSVEMMHHLIDVSQGDADMLADNDQYHERMDTLLNAADSDMPCAVMWSNPEPVMRDLIRLLTDERSKDWADEQAERLPWLASLLTAVEEEPVPDYEQFKKYFPPAGVIVTTDDTGYHFLTFQYSVNDDE